ncbi:MAG TPA: hypothetical protein VJ860_08315 [Polyangia bacterium]|jgi:hypothetical protein|nr:hypothetical protein [Polyangia bacterium]
MTGFPRQAWLAALPLWISACVVPVAPQFEDPGGNYSPFVASSVPTAGAELPASPDSTYTIQASLGDPNLDDVLWARWLIDYPPYDPSISLLAREDRLPPSGSVNREFIRFAPSCSDNQIVSGPASHRVTLSVADRPFLSPDRAPDLPLDSVSTEGFVVRTTWIVNLTCP